MLPASVTLTFVDETPLPPLLLLDGAAAGIGELLDDGRLTSGPAGVDDVGGVSAAAAASRSITSLSASQSSVSDELNIESLRDAEVFNDVDVDDDDDAVAKEMTSAAATSSEATVAAAVKD